MKSNSYSDRFVLSLPGWRTALALTATILFIAAAWFFGWQHRRDCAEARGQERAALSQIARGEDTPEIRAELERTRDYLLRVCPATDFPPPQRR